MYIYIHTVDLKYLFISPLPQKKAYILWGNNFVEKHIMQMC